MEGMFMMPRTIDKLRAKLPGGNPIFEVLLADDRRTFPNYFQIDSDSVPEIGYLLKPDKQNGCAGTRRV
jgi:hypothetical protein